MSKDGNGKVSYTLRLPQYLHKALTAEAERSFASINTIICQIVDKHYKQQAAEQPTQSQADEAIVITA